VRNKLRTKGSSWESKDTAGHLCPITGLAAHTPSRLAKWDPPPLSHEGLGPDHRDPDLRNYRAEQGVAKANRDQLACSPLVARRGYSLLR